MQRRARARKRRVLAGYGGEMRRKRRFLRWLAIPADFDHNMTLIAPVPTRAGVLFWSQLAAFVRRAGPSGRKGIHRVQLCPPLAVPFLAMPVTSPLPTAPMRQVQDLHTENAPSGAFSTFVWETTCLPFL